MPKVKTVARRRGVPPCSKYPLKHVDITLTFRAKIRVFNVCPRVQVDKASGFCLLLELDFALGRKRKPNIGSILKPSCKLVAQLEHTPERRHMLGVLHLLCRFFWESRISEGKGS